MQQSAITPYQPPAAAIVPPQADSDEQVVKLWLSGRPNNTQRAYRADLERFLAFVDKPLRHITLGDVQAYSASLEGLAPATIARRLNVVRSLLTFALRIGYIAYNVGAPIRTPSIKNTTAERILSEASVHKMLALEVNPRNHALLRLLYAGGLRVSEACGLTWRDLQEREDGAGQTTVFGKGGKTRAVLLTGSVWNELQALRQGAGADEPVFRSRQRSSDGTYHLTASQAERIVQAAARRAKVKAPVSPHWLRHAHASHALDRGAPIHLVQATLGHASVATTSKYLHARPKDSSSRYLAV